MALRGKKIWMLLYQPTPAYLPPMYHEAISLAADGAEVTAMCWRTDPAAPAEDRVGERFVVQYFLFRSLRFFERRYGLSPSGLFQSAIQYLTTYAEFVLRGIGAGLRARADLYEAHDLPALLPTAIAAMLHRRPLIYNAHELYPEMHARVKFSSIWKFLERCLVPRAAAVVTPEPNRSAIYAREYGARVTPLTVLNCPPYRKPLESSKIGDMLRERGVSFQTIALYQGLFDPSRCISELVEAAGALSKGVVLVLVGGGFGKWTDPQSAIGNRENVVVLPRVQYADLPAFTASADIGVFFYRNDCRNNYYCAPNKVHEYMMMGLPMVTVNYPGMRTIVEEGGIGLCVDPEKPAAIAGAINALAGDKERYAAMKARCLELARSRYNWENEYERIRQAYANLLNGVRDPQR
jgi:glycosyltransferase involved in cell wall biosynthesis